MTTNRDKLRAFSRCALLLAMGLGGGAWAAVSDQDAARLGKELTPVGAERAGNADGSIPEWKGGEMTAPAGWAVGQPRPDPYANEKPLVSIDSSNVEQHKAKLSEGQVALIQGLKGYRMDVYPSHRSCGYADNVYDRTKKNATAAKMGADGWSLEDAAGLGNPAKPDEEPQAPLVRRGTD